MQRRNEQLITVIGATGCTARLQTLRRTIRQGAKRVPEHQPDMVRRLVLHFSGILSDRNASQLLVSNILMSIYMQMQIRKELYDNDKHAAS
jgi:hypothetical protein